MKKTFRIMIVLVLILGLVPTIAAASGPNKIGINIVLNQTVNDNILKDLSAYGKVRDVLPQINAVMLFGAYSNLDAIKALPFVGDAAPDSESYMPPLDTVEVTDFADGLSTWDLDAINVTDFGFDNRTVAEDGTGVYVAILDTGLVQNWRMFFPQERISEEYAKAFGGGGNSGINITEVADKWEHDTNSHGTHVTSTILGYNLRGTPVNGVAPLATVIPVKVLNQNGSGWDSVIATAIVYVADLKEGPLADNPVVINMSLGGPTLDPVMKAAIDYAIGKGVMVVASAGNEGEEGMGYPGAYAPVISVAASGWIGEWTAAGWWNALNVPDPNIAANFYITDFSSREKPGQQLDVAAPGSWVVGPYEVNFGHVSYYYLGGTSMASPHVAGIVALMAQKDPGLVQSQAEAILKASALPLPAGCRNIFDPNVGPTEVCWGDDASGSGMVEADAALAATP